MDKALVLIVDDDFDTRSMLHWLLESEGFKVVMAGDTAAALKVLTNIRPDLILTDLMMPERAGFDLIGEIRRNPALRLVPIVVFSAYTKGYGDRIQETGATAVLRKPEDLFQLAETVKRLLQPVPEASQVVTDLNERKRSPRPHK